MVEYGCKMEGKVKAMQKTNSEGKDTGTQINSLEQKEEIHIQPKQNEETTIQNNEERLKNLQDNLNLPTSES